MPRSSISKPTSLRLTPLGLLLAQRAGADEVVLLPADDPAQVRLERASSSRRCRCRRGASPASRRSVSRAPRPHGISVGRPAGLENRLPDPVGRLRRNEDLEAVLAGVAGARDGGADVGDLAVGEPVVLHARQIDAGQRLQHLERRRALHREQRVARAGVDGDGVAGRLDVLGDPGVVLRDVAGVDDEQEVLRARGGRRAGRRRTCPAASAGRSTAPARPASFEASLDEMRWTAASASLPAISISPMWLTSNSPARVRTAMCSSAMPEYSTGMSQPPNGTIFAPEAR